MDQTDVLARRHLYRIIYFSPLTVQSRRTLVVEAVFSIAFTGIG
jgi:hypothetical protein